MNEITKRNASIERIKRILEKTDSYNSVVRERVFEQLAKTHIERHKKALAEA